ncbi:MAG: glycine cleavage system protein GcvH [Candidatus Omnitrophota bacterium]
MTDTSKLLYAKTHEWVSLSGTLATVGITEHAQQEISDVVFVELPKLEKVVKQGDPAMVLESVKAAFDIYAPLSGKIVKINEKLKDHPDLINKFPLGEGWLFQMECQQLSESSVLLSEADYQRQASGSGH